jgi:CheY-like chemotaxis protein
VFEPFARGQSETSAPATGTGLGLTIAKMLTDLMGGEMTVRSTPGEGSVFTVRLFLPELHGVLLPAPNALPLHTGYTGARRRVLVVDNEEADRELLARWLAPLGFEVMLATSGLDALALLDGLQPGEAGAPHAVFMDLAMPGIDGWETLRRLRAAGWSALPMAIVSANAFDKGLPLDDDSNAADADAGQQHPQDFFVKPVRGDDLLTWLGQQLSLEWITETPHESGAAPTAATAAPATRAELEPLLELVRLGYYKGIVLWLDEWVQRRPEQAGFAQGLRTLAREFRFETIEQQLLQHHVVPG